MTLWHDNLRRLIALVDEKLAAYDAHVGDFDHHAYTEWRARKDAAEKEMIAFFVGEEGARFTYRPPHEHKIRLAGIQSTSTSGYRAALRNWQAAARKKMGEAS